MTETSEYIESYGNMLEEHLEPYDRNKFGRYHKLLDEVLYPIDYAALGAMCAYVYDRAKYNSQRNEEGQIYWPWIHHPMV